MTTKQHTGIIESKKSIADTFYVWIRYRGNSAASIFQSEIPTALVYISDFVVVHECMHECVHGLDTVCAETKIIQTESIRDKVEAKLCTLF